MIGESSGSKYTWQQISKSANGVTEIETITYGAWRGVNKYGDETQPSMREK